MASDISVEKVMSLNTIALSGTEYSQPSDFRACAGNAAIIAISTAGSITISQQCSWNYDVNNPTVATWYDPTDTAKAALGVIQTALTVTTGVYVPFTPVMAPYVRLKVVEGGTAETIVTLYLLFRKDT